MRNYKYVINRLLNTGLNIPPARDKMPYTTFIPDVNMTFVFKDGFPIITGKTMPFYSIAAELIGFMKGLTDVRDFDKLGTKVWWDNAYKWYLETCKLSTDELSLQDYKNGKIFPNFPDDYDLGRIYSAQWRSWRGVDEIDNITITDQLLNMINNIINYPYSRYHVMTTWNPAEMNKHQVSQPNCHVYFQASCSPAKLDISNIVDILSYFLTDDTIQELLDNGYNPDKYLYTHLTQRSCDFFLGVPFNITSYSLFTIILGILTNSIPVQFNWHGVNTHLYSNHFKQADDYYKNDIYNLPKLRIKGIKTLKDIENIESLNDVKSHFELEGYTSSGKIKAPLSVGI